MRPSAFPLLSLRLVRTACALSLAGLAAALPAQTSVVSPSHLTNQEGNAGSMWPFFTTFRYMQYQRDMAGTSRMIKGMSFRRDSVNPNMGQGVKRTLELEIWMGEGDFDKRSATFASNYLANPSIAVTRRNVAAPDWTARPPTAPAAFDFQIPFSTPVAYTGKNHLLWEMVIWKTDQPRQLYFTDSISSGTTGVGTSRRIGLGCVAHQQSAAMYTSVIITTHRVPDRVRYFAATKSAPVLAPIVWLAGFQNPNLPLPTCGPKTLYTDGTLAFHGTTDTLGQADTGSDIVAPWHPALQGLKVYSQAFSTDATQPGIPIALSNGMESTVPALGQMPGPYARIAAEGDPLAKVGQLNLGWAVVVRFDL